MPGWGLAFVAVALIAFVGFCLFETSRRLALGAAALGCALGLAVCVGLAFAIFPQTRSGTPFLVAVLPVVGSLSVLVVVMVSFAKTGRVKVRTAAAAFGIAALPLLAMSAVAAQVVACRFDQCINL